MSEETGEMLADHEKRIALTEQAVLSMKGTTEGMSAKLDLILAQVTRVAVLEEKHSSQQADVSRAHTRITALSTSVETLSIETRAFINYTKGVTQILWALGAGVAILFVKVLFFAAHSGMTP